MFQLCIQEDSSHGLTSGSRSRESQTGRMRGRYEFIYTQVIPADSQLWSASLSYNKVRAEAVLGATQEVQWPTTDPG